MRSIRRRTEGKGKEGKGKEGKRVECSLNLNT